MTQDDTCKRNPCVARATFTYNDFSVRQCERGDSNSHGLSATGS